MFGDSHSKGAVTSAPELGLGGQQVRPLQGMSLQPLLQFLLHIAHIPPVTPAQTMPAQTLQQEPHPALCGLSWEEKVTLFTENDKQHSTDFVFVVQSLRTDQAVMEDETLAVLACCPSLQKSELTPIRYCQPHQALTAWQLVATYNTDCRRLCSTLAYRLCAF